MEILPDNPVIIALLLLVGVLIGSAVKSLLTDYDDEHNEKGKPKKAFKPSRRNVIRESTVIGALKERKHSECHASDYYKTNQP